jgi:DNA-binding NtrC family response regulator
MLTRVTNLLASPNARSVPARLRIMAEAGQDGEVALPLAGVVLGADPSCDVVIADPAVSRRHATVTAGEGGFTVEDLGSRNGTWIDGARVTRAVVPVGTMFRVGSTLVQVLPAEESIELPPSKDASFGAMLGESVAMRRLYTLLERASASAAPILLLGESGTGKELAARAVHDHSAHSAGPFVVFDCGAARDTLIESELFGHKRGAFTDAHADRPGAFALAHGGTLFLDEIGDLPLALQPKLLRLLERGEVTPLGSRKTESYEVRIVAATNKDLWSEVGRGGFRGDLYYRLAVVEAHLPALRQRTEDIAILAAAFLRASGAPEQVTEGPALARLRTYAWPGNVRELRNVITRAVALSPPASRLEQMPLLLRPGSSAASEPLANAGVPYHEAKDALLARFDRDYFADLLRRSGDNLSHAARIAGLERKYLYRLLERAGVRTPGGGGSEEGQ